MKLITHRWTLFAWCPLPLYLQGYLHHTESAAGPHGTQQQWCGLGRPKQTSQLIGKSGCMSIFHSNLEANITNNCTTTFLERLLIWLAPIVNVITCKLWPMKLETSTVATSLVENGIGAQYTGRGLQYNLQLSSSITKSNGRLVGRGGAIYGLH